MSILAPLVICVGVGVMPGHGISTFAIYSFKNQETKQKTVEKKLLEFQTQILQSF